MPRTDTLQTNFSAGEIGPEFHGRQDTEQYQNGAKSLRNRRCLIGGGTKRRPGTWYLSELAGPARAEDFIVNQSTKYVLIFGDGRVDAYRHDVATGLLTAAGSIASCPWVGSIYTEMDFVQSGNTMFLVHNDMRPQALVRTGASSWSVGNFTFYAGPGARAEQPYLKVAPAAWTLQPSALTGSVTITLGGGATAYFIAAHVGEHIRYVGKALLITAVAGDGLSATATVIENLPDTQDLTVGSSANFSVGEVVEGSVTGAKGVITSIPDSTSVFVVITTGLTLFATSENLVGPNAVSAISAVASAGTKAGVTDWDEQLFGAVHGYPSCIELHRNRLLFGGHEAAPDYLIGSALRNLYNFNVGDGSDGDAIMVSVGDAQAATIIQLHSAEMLIVLTDNGPYYVPENKASPFIPSSMAFYPFGSTWPATATAKARAFDGGVLFISESLVCKCRPTGNTNQAWEADDDVGYLASHLLSNPTRMTVVSNFASGPERYAVLQNDDGTLAVLQLVEVQKIRNLTPWDTTGVFTSVVGIGKYLYATTERTVAGNKRYFLELFDQDVTLDLATEYETAAMMDAGAPLRYGATPINVLAGNYHLGTYPLSLRTVPAGPYIVGMNYAAEMELLPPVIQGPFGSKAGDEMRIMEASFKVTESARFTANGHALQAYSVTDDVDIEPPRKNGWQTLEFLGWEQEPTILVTQPDPLPLTILAVKQKVAF